MRIVQVLGHRPIKKYVFTFYQLNGFQRVEWTEKAKAFINVMVRRKRTTGKMQHNLILRPVLRYIKVKLPNSVIQISFDGLVKLKEEESISINMNCSVG